MALKPTASQIPRPESPSKRTVVTLPGIPEAKPGPNAFAQKAARMERHRFEGNAFYQQEMVKRGFTPPNAIHPALRGISQADSTSGLMINTQDPRESTMTTMSPFINAGKSPASPPLALMPTDGNFAEPTRRGIIEERREQMVHEASGSDEERVPVYQTFAPTPKPSTGEFASATLASAAPARKPAGMSTPRKPRISLPRKEFNTSAADGGAKSPKRGFFEKLRMTKIGGGTPSPSMNTLNGTDGASEETENMPVKAQAVLGASPSKVTLGRSPSKQKKGLFTSRKVAEVTDLSTTDATSTRKSGSTTADEGPRTASTQVKTPQTAVSDPTHYSFVNGKRVPSQTLSDKGGYNGQDTSRCAIQRTQSLKYFDNGVPPTPPAKNTPPYQKAMKENIAPGSSNRVPFHQADSTPSKGPAGMVSTSDRLSPTKFGSYGHKETAQLVTKPSIYSLHASVVPEVMEVSAFEEIKARYDGLALEGFSMPEETQYHHHAQHSPETMYSPSIYSATDWGRHSVGGRTARTGHRFSMDELPTVAEAPSERDRASHSTKQSSSSGGSRSTIPVCYPDIASDPSMHVFSPPELKAHLSTASDLLTASDLVKAGMEVAVSTPDLPRHGHTHSRDHSNSPHHSVTGVSLFAAPLGEEGQEGYDVSPTSFNHPSAMPSPLQYLPATVYVPQPNKSFRKGQDEDERREHGFGQGLGIRSREQSGSPTRGRNVLDTAPVLAAQETLQRTASPRPSVSGMLEQSRVDVDPTKPGLVTQTTDKMDQMLEMLNKITSRNDDVAAMREELRATNARMDERLAYIESAHRASPSPPPSSYGFDGASSQREDSGSLGRSQLRVATDTAHDFYRLGQSSLSPVLSPVGNAEDGGSTMTLSAEAQRIAQLEQTNRELAEMVHGFAAKLEEMQRKMEQGG